MTANQGAANGSFSLIVNQLATPSKLSTKNVCRWPVDSRQRRHHADNADNHAVGQEL